MSRYEFNDKFGHIYRYHPRSDIHSVTLCEMIQADLLDHCPTLKKQVDYGLVACGINLPHKWPNGKRKTIDFAVGRCQVAEQPVLVREGSSVRELAEVFISCEAKSVMTEHSKAMPRVFDELSSSHEIVHHGNQRAIAAGITVVNISAKFISPTRNQHANDEMEITTHRQPHVTQRVVEHLRGLQSRDRADDVGFDAYCTIVVDCDNQSGCNLWTDPPAPQPGDSDHYDTFLDRLARFYTERFGKL